MQNNVVSLVRHKACFPPPRRQGASCSENISPPTELHALKCRRFGNTRPNCGGEANSLFNRPYVSICPALADGKSTSRRSGDGQLSILQLLLSAHPEGMVVNEIQEEFDIPNSTLSHHLDKLKNEGLVRVRRESTFLRYTADTDALHQLLQFLYSECCTHNKALKPEQITHCCR
jgi:ArsR family transcriptional regulator